nr:DNAse I-like superfamily protein [Tanacetum cinerariifolium]
MTHKQNHHPRTRTNQRHELLWPRIVIRKWLNRTSKNSEYSADPEDDDYDSAFDSDAEEEESYDWPKESRFKNNHGGDFQSDANGAFPRSRRRKSETSRAQYIDAKEL